MAITALPTPPNRSMTPIEFSDVSDVWVAALILWTTQVNATAVVIDQKATLAVQAAADAATHKNAALQAALAAETSAQTAAGISGAPMWVAGSSYAFGSFVWSPTSFLSYRRTVAGTTVSNTDPATGTLSGWKLAGSVMSMPQIEILSAGPYQLLVGYHYRVKNALAVLTMPANAAVQEQVRIEDASGGTTVQVWPAAGDEFKDRDVALLLSVRGFDRTLTKTATEGWV